MARSPRIPRTGFAILMASLLLVPSEHARGGGPSRAAPEARRIRQPVAMAFFDGGKPLLVANRQSGSLSVIDTASRRVMAAPNVGSGLAELAPLPDARHLLAVDQESPALLLMVYRDRSIRVVDQLEVSPDPVRLVVSADGSSVVVSSRWSRRLTFLARRPARAEEHP